MNTKHLRFFLAAVDEGNITRAAARCFVTQPTLSSGLVALEKELGGQLLERSKKGVQLTTLGEQTLDIAREIVHRVAYLRSMSQQKLLPHLRLAVARSVPVEYLRTSIEIFQEHGELENFRIREVDNLNGFSLLESNKIDILLTTEPGIPTDYQRKCLFVEQFGIAISSTNPLSTRELISSQELDQQAMVVRVHSEEANAATRHLKSDNSQPLVVARVTSDEYAMALVECGLGVCLLPRSIFDRYSTPHASTWIPLKDHDDELTREVHLVWKDLLWSHYF